VETAFGYIYLSRALAARGNFKEALKASLEALEIREVIYSPDHLSMGESYRDLVNRHIALDQLGEALKMARRNFEQVGGPRADVDMAYFYAWQGDREAHARLLDDWYADRDPEKASTDDAITATLYMLHPQPWKGAGDDKWLEFCTELLFQSDEPWIELGRGMAAYRAADDADAVERLDRALDIPDKDWRPLALAFKAMALHRLGKTEEAGEILNQAEDLHEATRDELAKRDNWRNVVDAMVAIREARGMMEATSR
jgi:tetratricopeptide (TPR) repeat protein